MNNTSNIPQKLKQGRAALPSAQEGVVLIEAMIAILIFSFAVLGIVGLQAAMIKNTSESKFRTDAAYLAQQTVGTLWADPSNLTNYLVQGDDISSFLPKGTRTIVQTATNQITVTIAWQQPGEDPHQFVTTATIVGN